MVRTDTPAPEPADRPVWHVPVRDGRAAVTVLRLFRQRDGSRCAVGFSSAAALSALLGPAQRSVTLTEPALRALIAPLGVRALVLDPQLVAPPVAPVPGGPLTAPPAQLQHQW
ncbi:SAV_915 family protein [Kitasatospora sp. NPDC048540]|uniref:SAV_915 family protein n=1 Tax=unclassified Kitasatospora TaxID=2633591 RepID=UPI00053A138C|nr:SAV_915 family protein [Kitasatospora sp. MBT63]